MTILTYTAKIVKMILPKIAMIAIIIPIKAATKPIANGMATGAEKWLR